jgi:hypothetical protein
MIKVGNKVRSGLALLVAFSMVLVMSLMLTGKVAYADAGGGGATGTFRMLDVWKVFRNDDEAERPGFITLEVYCDGNESMAEEWKNVLGATIVMSTDPAGGYNLTYSEMSDYQFLNGHYDYDPTGDAADEEWKDALRAVFPVPRDFTETYTIVETVGGKDYKMNVETANGEYWFGVYSSTVLFRLENVYEAPVSEPEPEPEPELEPKPEPKPEPVIEEKPAPAPAPVVVKEVKDLVQTDGNEMPAKLLVVASVAVASGVVGVVLARRSKSN